MAATAVDSAATSKQKRSVPTNRVQGGLLDPEDAVERDARRVHEAQPAHAVAQPGHVHRRDRRGLGPPSWRSSDPTWFAWLIVVWLWLTVLFANLAEAVAEGRGKAQADALRGPRPTPWPASHRLATGRRRPARTEVAAPLLKQGDVVVVEAGQLVPGDGDVVEGIACVDESAITGESAPVIRETGGDRIAVTGGTKVLSDRIVVEITQKPGESFIDRMIALVEGANRQKTPNEIALNILLASLTIIFLFAIATLQPLAIFSKCNNPGVPDTGADSNGITGIVLVSLLVCLIPTTIGALLSAIGIAGMDRLGAAQRAGDERPRGGSRRRREHPAARQDRHDHAWQSASTDFIPIGRTPRGARRRGATVVAWRRNTRRTLGRGACQTAYGLRERAAGELRTRLGAIHRTDEDERRRPRRASAPQGRGRLRSPPGSATTAATSAVAPARSSTASAPRAAPRWWSERS